MQAIKKYALLIVGAVLPLLVVYLLSYLGNIFDLYNRQHGYGFANIIASALFFIATCVPAYFCWEILITEIQTYAVNRKLAYKKMLEMLED